MIQDIGVEQLKNEYHPKPPKDESRIMIFDAGKLLCRINEEMQIAYPKYGEWRKNKADEGTLIYLFSIGEETYYLLYSPQKTEIEGYVYEKMFRLRRTFPERERFAGVSAYHLYTWYENNHFCGKCGTALLRMKTKESCNVRHVGMKCFQGSIRQSLWQSATAMN